MTPTAVLVDTLDAIHPTMGGMRAPRVVYRASDGCKGVRRDGITVWADGNLDGMNLG